MPASPVIISPNGSGHSSAFATPTLVFGGVTSVILANDFIFATIATDDTNTVSSVTATGLTFSRRGGGQSLQVPTGQDATMSVWGATASAPMTGFAATANLSGSADGVCAIWAIIRGTPSSASYDPNASLPAITTGTLPATVVYSTTNADDLIFFVTVGNNALWMQPPPLLVTPSSWTWVDGITGGLFGEVTMGLYMHSVSSPQSFATADQVSGPGPFVNGTVFYVDALTGDGVTPPSGTRPFLIKPRLGA